MGLLQVFYTAGLKCASDGCVPFQRAAADEAKQYHTARSARLPVFADMDATFGFLDSPHLNLRPRRGGHTSSPQSSTTSLGVGAWRRNPDARWLRM